jgi:anthranilate synthase component 1
MNGSKISFIEFENDEKISEECFEMKNPLIKIREYFNKFKVYEFEQLPPFYGGAIGFLGYETARYFEEIPVNNSDDTIPDALLVIPEIVLVFDIVKRNISVIVLSFPENNPEGKYENAIRKIEMITDELNKPVLYNENHQDINQEIIIEHKMDKDYFLKCVEKSKEYIINGDIIQVVFSQQFSIRTDSSPFELYRTLRIMNPSPYLFLLNFDDFSIIGSSPEVMVRLQGKEILLKPIAGTAKRGKSIAEDEKITNELINDPKERAEHIMLVDLGRNDLGRIALPGSVKVSDFMTIEKYSHVMHIVSTIKAELNEKYDVFDVIRATFPAGTLTGAPKIRSMEIIAELETKKRGPYGGMIFNLGFNGNLDSCITIRTIILKDGIANFQAGAGIVADSDPEREYQETMNKAQVLINTIKQTK